MENESGLLETPVDEAPVATPEPIPFPVPEPCSEPQGPSEPDPETKPIPAALLARLKAMQEVQQALIEGCAMGMGIDFRTHHADFNVLTGTVTITPLSKG